jgi:hypothetical protein
LARELVSLSFLKKCEDAPSYGLEALVILQLRRFETILLEASRLVKDDVDQNTVHVGIP